MTASNTTYTQLPERLRSLRPTASRGERKDLRWEGRGVVAGWPRWGGRDSTDDGLSTDQLTVLIKRTNLLQTPPQASGLAMSSHRPWPGHQPAAIFFPQF